MRVRRKRDVDVTQWSKRGADLEDHRTRAPARRSRRRCVAHEDAAEWDGDIVLSGSEVAEDRPDDWRLEAWLPRRPRKADLAALAALFGGTMPTHAAEPLADEDWVTLSQQDLVPIRAGRFHVHTPEHPALQRARA